MVTEPYWESSSPGTGPHGMFHHSGHLRSIGRPDLGAGSPAQLPDPIRVFLQALQDPFQVLNCVRLIFQGQRYTAPLFYQIDGPPSPLLRAGLSPVAWRGFSPVEKLHTLYGLSLDAALEDLSYRGDEAYRIAARTAARHDVMMIGAKYAIEPGREREREKALQALVRDLPDRFKP